MSPSRANSRGAGHGLAGETVTVVVGGGAAYFASVFLLGFGLGILRTLWLEPVLGVRWAELVELPVMLVAIYFVARWIARRFSLATRPVLVGFALGAVGLSLLLVAELTVVLSLRGLTVAQYVAGRDPVSGTAYALSLLLFAAMPAMVRR